jgi:hypothetical protein
LLAGIGLLNNMLVLTVMFQFFGKLLTVRLCGS